MTQNKISWIDKIPHPLAILFFMLIGASVLTYIIPAGEFDRELVDGVARVVNGTFHSVDQTPVNLFDTVIAIGIGFQEIADIVFIVFASAAMFGIFEKNGMLEDVVGSFVKSLGLKRKYLIVGMMTYMYGLLGIFVGYENNIALAPIAVIVSLAIGGDVLLGAGMAVGGISVGFGLAPFNPYTVGVGHQIAEMPLFSGWQFRSVLVFALLTVLVYYNISYFKKILANPEKSLSKGIDTHGLELSKPLEEYKTSARDKTVLGIFLLGLLVMLYGVFNLGWYINEISAIFIIIGIVSGLISRMSIEEISQVMSKSFETCALAAILIGAAQGLKVVMDAGHISDTIAHSFIGLLESLPKTASAVVMTMTQSITNIFIPGGSGQALVTLPIMIPVGDTVGITRQCTILAFQIGDGITNIFTPTLGGLIAMLGLCRVPYGSWIKYIFKFTAMAYVVCWIAMAIAVAINYGPM
ncbi:YfcC family protein [Flammeovirga agarivorans]|uniref:YfcC family protein n=1 Tax=Flammeovirga agarivorans TaxID=2726742 RepID=A0A7X8SNU2_9BACT|nr:TIGR00366 family protein [Flammeovirga agarivorans]NLR93578.1 YfcC family protein [Flammeovirga agarivorans]